ncbi:DUF2318 domain-containing protein [Alloscardovia macacae]|uniref:Membrane iron-sulfur containing protein FtrD-like domain-containing protein n=1 Tax=Alloscardovia macacae TaxID=1160091 RepID=A0A261F787_9BIFI|nr:DUF2318 domain-containing protein [Alloscardovia macacae]OZG54893.1 hypothetical protein ALMA_0218 [Alloscardovia macacae]
MLEQFVTALPGSLAPILLTMVISAVCKPADARYHTTRVRYVRVAGVVLGIVAAIVFATLRGTGLLTQRTIVNQPTLVACILADIAALVAFAALVKNEPEQKLYTAGNVIFGVALALTYFRALPDVILRVTNFVETGQTPFTSDMLLRALGFTLGIAASVVIAAIFSALVSTVGARIFAITGIALTALIAAQHVIDLTQILFSTRAIRLPSFAFRALVWGLNNTLTLVIAQAVVFVIPVAAAFVAGWKTAVEGQTIAEVRIHRKFKRHAYVAVAFSLLAVLGVGAALTYGVAATHVEIKLSEPEKYVLEDGVAKIKASQVSDGHLHRFEYKASDGTTMRFLAIKKGSGGIVVVLDACDNCGDAGYYEKDGKVICKKCDVAMNIATIGFKGGCNPVPIDFENDGTTVTVQTSVLDANSSYFRR